MFGRNVLLKVSRKGIVTSKYVRVRLDIELKNKGKKKDRK